MASLINWLGVCAVAAGLTFIAFASAGRLLPMRLESSATIDARDYVGVTEKEPPISYESLFREVCVLPNVQPPEFTIMKTPQSEFTIKKTPADVQAPEFAMVKTPRPEFIDIDLKQFLNLDTWSTKTDDGPSYHGRSFTPIMLSTATKSGHCKVMFDVDEKGNTFNIKITFCSEDLFVVPTIESVRRWRYSPRIMNGKPVVRKRVATRISYKLMDEEGNPLPE